MGFVPEVALDGVYHMVLCSGYQIMLPTGGFLPVKKKSANMTLFETLGANDKRVAADMLFPNKPTSD